MTAAGAVLPALRAEAGDPPPHAFFTRQGGVSTGCFESLNCGFGAGDSTTAVAENRRRAARTLGLDAGRLLTCRQVHGSRVVRVTTPWDIAAAPEADGLATRTPGLALGVLTADCAPVLFWDRAAGVIGAAHAGWQGALSGVLEATVDAMVGLGAATARIRAVIGPCIGPDSYEVGAEFCERFLVDDPANTRFFGPAPRPGHHLFDLPGYGQARLEAAGLPGVAWTGGDTLAEASRFFSYRRECLTGGRDYGRGLSVIRLPGD